MHYVGPGGVFSIVISNGRLLYAPRYFLTSKKNKMKSKSMAKSHEALGHTNFG
jgi:hypothetical protein